MTATPIPRSLALTHYGDLDVSILDELPPGRTPIRTVAMHASKMDAALARVGERVREGEQAYIVVPAIEPEERGDPNLEELVPRLQQGPLADVPFGVVHGRLDRATRDDTMAAFRDGTLRVLVATTVIEVGVDVPNASLMVILGADRFGLAQLHQLRGRVGRGAAASTCVLVADPATEDGQARLDAVVGTTDGFVIAEEDLRLRGPGEVVGERQSGLARLQFARLPGDEDLLEQSREEAAPESATILSSLHPSTPAWPSSPTECIALPRPSKADNPTFGGWRDWGSRTMNKAGLSRTLFKEPNMQIKLRSGLLLACTAFLAAPTLAQEEPRGDRPGFRGERGERGQRGQRGRGAEGRRGGQAEGGQRGEARGNGRDRGAGGMFGGLPRWSTEPDFLRRDLRLVDDMLLVADEQLPMVEAFLADYEEGFQKAREEIQAKLRELREANRPPEPSPEEQEEMRAMGTELREKCGRCG